MQFFVMIAISTKLWKDPFVVLLQDNIYNKTR